MLTRQTLADSWHDWWAHTAAPRGPLWLFWVWALAITGPIAMGYTALAWLAWGARFPAGLSLPAFFANNLAVSATISLLIQGLMFAGIGLIGRPRLARLRHWQALLFHNGLAVLGVVIGLPLGLWLAKDWFHVGMPAAPFGPWAALTFVGTVALLLFFNGQARKAMAARQATEARLKLLQAQIEPHFLFNTLANVASLIEPDGPKARHMLESFVDYLRCSLTSLRLDRGTLGAELAMAEAYLVLMSIRMEDRLRYRIEADADARAASVPPLLLQPLVENAIRHGLEPTIDGGEVVLRAVVRNGRLVVTVHDDGQGLEAPKRPGPATGGNGLALENARARLVSLFGGRASLTLAPAEPGTIASLTLPFETTGTPSP